MRSSAERKEKRKGKFRFNFIDLLVLTLTIVMLLSFFVSAFYERDQHAQLLVSLRIEEGDAYQFGRSGLSLYEGETVFMAGGETVYGSLAKDYDGSESLLVMQVDAQRQGSDLMMGGVRLYIGQTVNIRCGQLRAYRLKVENITEVAENDGDK